MHHVVDKYILFSRQLGYKQKQVLTMNSATLLFAGLMSVIFGGCALSNIEEPKYEVIRDYGEFELRQYQPTIVAETTVSGEFASSANVGFRRLANYIFGGNRSKTKIAMTAPVTSTSENPASEKISMTAPVAQVATGSNQWLISFTMPSKYTMATLPEPIDPLVRLRAIPAATYAAIQFSGFNSAALVEEKTTTLRSLAARENLNLADRVLYARYNPPWTPWFIRRNEILIETKTAP